MGKGGGASAETSATRQLARFGRSFQRTSRGARKSYFDQLEEALNTGGVGARIPIIQRAIEASNASSSKTLGSTQDSLARSGLVGTPEGQRILAQVRQQGAYQSEQTPTNIINQLLAQAPNAVLGSASNITSGLQSAAATEGGLQASNQAQEAASQSAVVGGGAAAAGAIAAAVIAAV